MPTEQQAANTSDKTTTNMANNMPADPNLNDNKANTAESEKTLDGIGQFLLDIKNLVKKQNLPPVDHNRTLYDPQAEPDSRILEILEQQQKDGNKSRISKHLYKHLRLFDLANYMDRDLDDSIMSYDQKHMLRHVGVCRKNAFDGTYAPYTDTFKGTYKPDKWDGTTDYTLKSQTLLKSIRIETVNTGVPYTIQTIDVEKAFVKDNKDNNENSDNTSENNNNKSNKVYTYSLDAFCKFPDFVRQPCKGSSFRINVEPSDVEVSIDYKSVLIDPGRLWDNFNTVFQIFETDKPGIIVCLGSLWTPSPIFDLNENTYFFTDFDTRHKPDIDKYIAKIRQTKRINDAKGYISACQINRIEIASDNTFNFHTTPLDINKLQQLNPQLTITDRFIQRDGKDIAYLENDTENHSKDFTVGVSELSNDTGSVYIMGLNDIENTTTKPIETTPELKLPLYVLKGDNKSGTLELYLASGETLRVYRDGEYTKIAMGDTDLYSVHAPTKKQQFWSTMPGPYKKLGIVYRNDSVDPDWKWFEDEKGQPFVFHTGIKILTMPLQAYITVPESKCDFVVKKLTEEGYKVRDYSIDTNTINALQTRTL